MPFGNMFSAGTSYANNFTSGGFGGYSTEEEPANEPPPFLIGSHVPEMKQNELEEVFDQLTSGYNEPQQYSENNVFRTEFYEYKEPNESMSTFSTGQFGARAGFGAYGQMNEQQESLSQANNFNLKHLEPEDFAGFAGLEEKLESQEEDQNRITEKIKDLEEKLIVIMKNEDDITHDINEDYLAELILRSLILNNEEKEESFLFGYCVTLEGFYQRLQLIEEQLKSINEKACTSYKIDEALISRAQHLSVKLGELFE